MKRLAFGLLAATVTASLLFAWPRSATEVQAGSTPARLPTQIASAGAGAAIPETRPEPAIRVIDTRREDCGAWPYYKRSCLVRARPVATPEPAPAALAVAAAPEAEPAEAPGIPAALAAQVGLIGEAAPVLPDSASAPAAAAAAAPVAPRPADIPAVAAAEAPPRPAAPAETAAEAPPALKRTVQRRVAAEARPVVRRKLRVRSAHAGLYDDDDDDMPPFGYGRSHYGYGHYGHFGPRGRWGGRHH